MYIYKVTNITNNKVYIGLSSKTAEESVDYYGSGRLITKAIKEDGKHCFIKEILERDITDGNYLAERELYYINYYDATNPLKGYNIIDHIWPNTFINTKWYTNEESGDVTRSKEHPGEGWLAGRGTDKIKFPRSIGKWWHNTLTGETIRTKDNMEFPWIKGRSCPKLPEPKLKMLGPKKPRKGTKKRITVTCNALDCNNTFIIPEDGYRTKRYCSKSCASKVSGKNRKGMKYKKHS